MPYSMMRREACEERFGKGAVGGGSDMEVPLCVQHSSLAHGDLTLATSLTLLDPRRPLHPPQHPVRPGAAARYH